MTTKTRPGRPKKQPLQDLLREQTLAARLMALGCIPRLEILRLLASGEQLCVKDLFERTRQSQGNTSIHLKRLRDLGIVVYNRDGKRSYYSINDDAIREVIEVLTGLLSNPGLGKQKKQ